MKDLKNNLSNRELLIDNIRKEIIGPYPCGNPIKLSEEDPVIFSKEEFYTPKMQESGEEILWQDNPIKRYGAGILYPHDCTSQNQLNEEANSTLIEEDLDIESVDIRVDEILEKQVQKYSNNIDYSSDETDNFDVNLANEIKPSAMGLSFLIDITLQEIIKVEVDFGFYIKKEANIKFDDSGQNTYTKYLWLRKSYLGNDKVKPVIEFTKKELINNNFVKKWVPGFENKLELTIVIRPYSDQNNHRILTVCLVNRQDHLAGQIDELCFFQCSFRVSGKSNIPWILHYPEYVNSNPIPSDDSEKNRLLYRDKQTFAIGHGVTANWDNSSDLKTSSVWTDSLPSYETTNLTADIYDKKGKLLKVSMRKLAGLDEKDDGDSEIENLINLYEDWINNLEKFDKRKISLPENLHDTANSLIYKCNYCLDRIKKGYKFLKSENETARNAREAFKLTNHSMLISQLRSSREVRNPILDNDRLTWDNPIYNPDENEFNTNIGYWRAFQIAFILMSIKGICDPSDKERLEVDLIWFPTGGGKTEAYLGLTAFTIFFNRLQGIEVNGADVLMRYTLRLLTAQQFQRAALLFCSMEYLRHHPKYTEKLGEKEFILGMWVGGTTTPNTRSNAKSRLSKLKNNVNSENPFVLLKCPWCNAKFGPNEHILFKSQDGKLKKRFHKTGSAWKVLAYEYGKINNQDNKSFSFRCSDINCFYGKDLSKPRKPKLPVYIIDEDIYDNPPNLIIATVDKYAMLAWKPEIRSIFGIDDKGKHKGLPPTLIIQDELHLISGPLGSMVGQYETIVEELCTKRNEKNEVISPKIIASTATISRAEEQIKALYSRENVTIFPPSGLEANDTFFAKEEIDENGEKTPGRKYIGIMAPAHGSMQTTQARIYAALLQYTSSLISNVEKDPWWTLICFFNSLRELGGAGTLLVADTRDYLRVIIDRHGYSYSDIRQLHNCLELTSRIRNDRIPLSIQKLELAYYDKNKECIDVCLASSIIEVGIDIDRLSLMVIIGQPKTTSQYIQVSSRIGRNKNSPGLVFTLYSPNKPRDRSHYERFRSYHQRLYAQVEPTSVTPFSPPAVDRAIHAIIVSLTRQLQSIELTENSRPFPLQEGEELRKRIINLVTKRVNVIDPEEIEYVNKQIKKKLKEWKSWDPYIYGNFRAVSENTPLIHPAGMTMPDEWKGHSWPTLTSLRDVDATCEANITAYYNESLIDE